MFVVIISESFTNIVSFTKSLICGWTLGWGAPWGCNKENIFTRILFSTSAWLFLFTYQAFIQMIGFYSSSSALRLIELFSSWFKLVLYSPVSELSLNWGLGLWSFSQYSQLCCVEGEKEEERIMQNEDGTWLFTIIILNYDCHMIVKHK